MLKSQQVYVVQEVLVAFVFREVPIEYAKLIWMGSANFEKKQLQEVQVVFVFFASCHIEIIWRGTAYGQIQYGRDILAN